MIKILFIGDIIGEPGRKTVKKYLDNFKQNFDFIIANAENAAGGAGLTEEVAEKLFDFGINLLTTGNHVWDRKEFCSFLEKESRILRPLNYPNGVPGRGAFLGKVKDEEIAIVSLLGRVFMSNLDCPFQVVKIFLENLPKNIKIILIEMHAEATSEKMAMGHFLDGKVTAVFGTHTHVMTADERILENGTAYITDIGMTGPLNSVIGIRKEQILKRFLYQMPVKFEVAKGPTQFSAAILEIDEVNKLPRSIRRIQKTYNLEELIS